MRVAMGLLFCFDALVSDCPRALILGCRCFSPAFSLPPMRERNVVKVTETEARQRKKEKGKEKERERDRESATSCKREDEKRGTQREREKQ